MFQRIQHDELVPGGKYKFGENKGIYIKPWMGDKLYLKFYPLERNDFCRFRFLSTDCDFYKFVPQYPQLRMERRAVNLVLRRLIGDEYFEW